MSLDPILWALKDAPVADSLERLILVVLAEHAGSSDGCNAFPSRDTMASLAVADPKTVQRVTQRLIKRKLIARGDQSAARYIRADRRPVVYDLLIPYSWFPNPERMNEERRKRGLPPLTPEDRPDIAPAPEKARRKDAGVPRKKAAQRGDSKSPRESQGQSGHGGTVSPARGDCKSRTGGLEDPRTSSKNHPSNLSPRGRARVGDPAAVAPVVEEREKPAAPKDKNNRQPATALPGQRAGEVDKLERVPTGIPGAFQEFQAPVPAAPHTTPQTAATTPQAPTADPDAAARVVDAYTAALGRPVLNGTRTRLHHQAAEALTAGYPETWVTDRARELAANVGKGWTDLAVHIEKSTVPLPGAAPASPAARRGLPEWCTKCGDGNPAARTNPRFRTTTGMPDGQPCTDCHPAVVTSV